MLGPYWINSGNLANVWLKINFVKIYNQSTKFAKIFSCQNFVSYGTLGTQHTLYTDTHYTRTTYIHTRVYTQYSACKKGQGCR